MPSDLIDRWQALVMGDGRARSVSVAGLRRVASGGARAYEHGLDVYLKMEHLGLRRRETLPVPVVSIGNLTVGGTGKTPMTSLVCRRLSDMGKRVAVLSRGHGGKGAGVRLVSDAHGNIARDAADVGDEPVLLAQNLPNIPVLVGKDRRESGREAMRRFPLDVLVLDDGFQYWQLARDLDIVLLDSRSPFDNGHCLPRGLLREPPQHLNRAGIIVATRADAIEPTDRAKLAQRVAALAPDAPLFFARHQPVALIRMTGGPTELLPVNAMQGLRVVAWSAIARPDSFVQALQQDAGVIVTHHVVKADHAVPSAEDVQHIEVLMRETSAQALVITEKDSVKWPMIADFPVFALQIEMIVENEAEFIDAAAKCVFGKSGA